MKKDIFKAFMALSFIFISLIGASYLKEAKEVASNKYKENRSKEYDKIYQNTYGDYGFNLPLIAIDTNGKSISNKEKTVSNIQVYNSDKENNYLNDNPSLESSAMINIRGNTTKYFPKKQYSLKLVNKKGNEKDKKMLGMDKDSDWVLNGPFADKSLMRNYIAYTVGSNIMEYAPDVRFCEVFVIDDGSSTIQKKHYKGVYLLIEKIKRGEDRVDIVKTHDNTDETSFIISRDRNKEDNIVIGNYGYETHLYDYALNIEYPKKDLTPGKYNYINKYISEFERILYSDKFNDPKNGYRKYIDVDSFVDFYIINEFFLNTDAGIFSTYMYKDYNEKMKAGPIWDFNRSLGNNEVNKDSRAFEYEGFFMLQRYWFDRLMEDRAFANKVVSRYKELRKNYLSDEYLINLIDKTKNYLGTSVKRNFDKWSFELSNQSDVFGMYWNIIQKYGNGEDAFNKFLGNNKDLLEDTTGKANSYEEEINLMKNFIKNRGKWMDENIDSLSKWAS